MSKRIENEIAHGKKLLAQGAESIWNWDSQAGKVRADRRANYFIEFAKAKATDKVLEIGCGTGLFTRKFFAVTKTEIVAIDISDELLSTAQQLLPQVKFIKADAMNLPFPGNAFDIVYGSSILHHLEFDKSLEEIYRVLKPGGRMIFAEPNIVNPQILAQKNIGFLKKWSGDSPDESAINRWKFSKLMAAKGFTNIRIFPYDFLHPLVPGFLIKTVSVVGNILEKIPVIREIAGSVVIYAEK